jgi:hypothetical protein
MGLATAAETLTWRRGRIILRCFEQAKQNVLSTLTLRDDQPSLGSSPVRRSVSLERSTEPPCPWKKAQAQSHETMALITRARRDQQGASFNPRASLLWQKPQLCFFQHNQHCSI